MREDFLDGRVRLWHGDSRHLIADLPDGSSDSIVTDQPYALVSIVKRFGGENAAPASGNDAYQRASAGFMGKTWDTGETAFAVAFWQECLRVLKPGGHVVAFGGTRTFHRLVVAVEDAGFEIRDCISWNFGSGFPKSHNVGEGLGTALKPAMELITLARKPLVGTVAANVLRFGTGALHIDACRVPSSPGQHPENDGWENEKILCASCAAHADSNAKHGAPATKASIATRHVEPTSSERDGTNQPDTGKTDIGCFGGTMAVDTVISSSTAEFGNKPTGSSQPDGKSTTLTATEGTTASPICNSCGKPITSSTTSGFTPRGKNGLPLTQPAPARVGPPGRWPSNLIHDGSDEVVEAFPDTISGDRNGVKRPHSGVALANGVDKMTYRHHDTGRQFVGDSGSAARFFYSAKADETDRFGSRHPTVKPVDLMQYLCRLVTPHGGLVLDPFAGSGSTGEAAWREGFRALLFERESDSVDDIRYRLMHADAGPVQRQHAIIKKKGKVESAGPLFDIPEAAE